MKNTTAEYRINLIRKLDKNLLNKRINYLYNEVLKDEKYNTPILKGPKKEVTFVEFLKGMNQSNLVDIKHIPFGEGTITLDELFDKFSKDKYIEEKLVDVYEPTSNEVEKATVNNIIGITLYNVVLEKKYDKEAIQNNNTLISYLYGDFADSIENPLAEEQSGILKHKIETILKRVYIKKDDKTEVEKIEEMEVGNGYVTTPSLIKLTPNERNAVIEGLNTSKVIKMSGDDEEVEIIEEEPEVIATMKNIKPVTMSGDDEEVEIIEEEPEVIATMKLK